jgi:hypothetical protein
VPYNTKADGDGLTASFINANWRDQVVSTVTSGSRPSGTEGQFIYETDTDRVYGYNGGWIQFGSLGAHTSFTPTVGGTGWAVGNGTATGQYIRIGRFIYAIGGVSFGSTSTFGAGGLTLSLPVAAATTVDTRNVTLVDTGTATRSGNGEVAAATTTLTIYDDSGATWANVTSTVPHTWASTDIVRFNICYEASS